MCCDITKTKILFFSQHEILMYSGPVVSLDVPFDEVMTSELGLCFSNNLGKRLFKVALPRALETKLFNTNDFTHIKTYYGLFPYVTLLSSNLLKFLSQNRFYLLGLQRYWQRFKSGGRLHRVLRGNQIKSRISEHFLMIKIKEQFSV